MTDAAAREQEGTETAAGGHGLRVPFSARARRRLSRAVALKLALDLTFVCVVVLYSYLDTFGPRPAGSLERADARGVSGWVEDESRAVEAVEVQLFVDGRFVASAPAEGPLPDDPAGNVRRGFAFNFDPPLEGAREVRVYAVRPGRGGARRVLRQVGDARTLAAR